MNFKKISLIISFLSLNVLSVPVSKNEIPTDVVEVSYENSDAEQNIIGTNEFSDEEFSVVFEDEDSALENNEAFSDNENFEIPTIEAEAEECLTNECVKTSQRILSSMDTSANPCENFFQFTCGNWMNDDIKTRNPLGTIVLAEVDYSIRKGLMEVVESDYIVNESLSEKDQEYDKMNFEKMKNIYDSCLNVELVNSKGKEPLINFLNELNIPDYKERLNDPEGLSELLAKLHHYYIDAFFHISYTLKNDKIYPIIFPQYTDLSKEKFNNSTIVSYYKQYVTDTLTNLFDSNERNIEAMTEIIIDIERKIANINNESEDKVDEEEKLKDTLKVAIKKSLEGDIQEILEATTESIEDEILDILENKEDDNPSNDDKTKENDNSYSIKTLNEKFPFINWKSYFNKGFELYNIDYSFDDETIVVTFISDYLKELTNILLKLDTDSLYYYIEWLVINSRNHLISEEFFNIKKEFMNNIDEDFEETFKVEDSLECLDKVNNIIPLILGKYFVEKQFSDEVRETAGMLISNLKEAMIKRIPKMEWIDEETKKHALEKVLKMDQRVGYQDFIMEPEKLYNTYKNLKFAPGDRISIENYFYVDFYNQVYKAFTNDPNILVNLIYDSVPPQTANAFYLLPTNTMMFPAGIFQPPLFGSGDPDYLVYGGIGSIIGHELTHAFDNSGRLYDAEGRITNWWSDAASSEFERLSECFVDQYNAYYLEDSEGNKYFVDGELSLGENLADNGGLARAYEAWRYSLENDPEAANERNKKLPGLSEYTLDQMFYIAFGQSWCGEYDDKIIRVLENYNDPHTLFQNRVHGVVTNSAHFAKTFNCPLNSPMNPENKCLIW